MIISKFTIFAQTSFSSRAFYSLTTDNHFAFIIFRLHILYGKENYYFSPPYFITKGKFSFSASIFYMERKIFIFRFHILYGKENYHFPPPNFKWKGKFSFSATIFYMEKKIIE